MLSEKIRTLRKERGLSQEALAEKLDISRQAISKWEAGSSNPDIEYVIKMSDIFEVSTDYILKNTPIEKNKLNKITVEDKKIVSKASLILGIVNSSLGLFGIFILKLLSSIYPAEYSNSSITEIIVDDYNNSVIEVMEEVPMEIYVGLQGFLKTHNIEWLFSLCIILLAIGVICFVFFINLKRVKKRK